jgi:hypothetical protein
LIRVSIGAPYIGKRFVALNTFQRPDRTGDGERTGITKVQQKDRRLDRVERAASVGSPMKKSQLRTRI